MTPTVRQPHSASSAPIAQAPRLTAHGRPLHPVFGLIIGFGAICLVAVAVHALFAAL